MGTEIPKILNEKNTFRNHLKLSDLEALHISRSSTVLYELKEKYNFRKKKKRKKNHALSHKNKHRITQNKHSL